ncbi:cytochrome P450 [Dentipellis sp. KUC8613]|nr:cytochrome P450 [Dentipellis sp. KUC8613]
MPPTRIKAKMFRDGGPHYSEPSPSGRSVSIMLLLALYAAIAVISFLLTWKLVRERIRQRPLRKIPGPSPTSLLKGHLPQIYDREHGWEFHTGILEKFGSVVKLWGWAGDSLLYVSDPRAIHNIIVKDQYIYEETSDFITNNRLTFGPGLLGTLGEHHRQQRKLLNPIFSINHMRYMIPIFQTVCTQLRDQLVEKVKTGPKEVEVVHWMTATALELVGQAGLGYSFECINDTSGNEFASAVKNLLPTMFPLRVYRVFLPWIVNYVARPIRGFAARHVPWKAVRSLVGIVDVMHKTSQRIISEKRMALLKGDEAVLHQIGEGRDILSVLLKANMSASEEDRLSEEELLGQMSTLLFAAMDTTSSALSRIIYKLAERQDVQDKLRDELVKAQEASATLDYDMLHNLPYLDAVCRETLRVHPPVPFVSRTTRKDVVLPLGTPITATDGSKISEIHIAENTDVFISIIGVNRSVAIWGADATEWKPERWLSPLPQTVTDAHIPGVYSNTMTFLGGGRACIGFKFSQLEMKVVLAMLLPALRFRLTETKIHWKLSSLLYPSIGTSRKPLMPLEVSLVSEKSG